VDFECQDSGYLAKILVAGGTADVAVGRLIAIMVDSKEAVDAFKNVKVEDLGLPAAPAGGSAAPAAPKPAAAPAAAAPAPAPAAAAPAQFAKAPAPGGRIVASPLAKKVRDASTPALHAA
jgi:pyruvate dehydrogenase E2 component (dihydrolipoamide acetyltransferase)